MAHLDRVGVPRLSWPQLLEPPAADPHAGWCGRGAQDNWPSLSQSAATVLGSRWPTRRTTSARTTCGNW